MTNAIATQAQDTRTSIMATRNEFPDNGILVINKGDFENVNLLTPVTTIKRGNPLMGVLTAVVRLDPKTDFYKVKGGKYAPTTAALFKLMEAAGIQPMESKAVTPSICAKCQAMNRGTMIKCWECPHEYDYAHTATIRQQQPDGTYKRIQATYEFDFVAMQKQGISPDDMDMKRRHRVALCESGAYARALRKCMHIGTYYQNELARPFVIHRVYLDTANLPIAAQLDLIKAADHGLADASAALFGAPERDALPAPDESGDIVEIVEDDPGAIEGSLIHAPDMGPAPDYDEIDEFLGREPGERRLPKNEGAAGESLFPEMEPEYAPRDKPQRIPPHWYGGNTGRTREQAQSQLLNALGQRGIANLAEGAEAAGIAELEQYQGSAFSLLKLIDKRQAG